MGKRIHVRIFLPVLAVIAVLSLAAWSAFYMTSDWYVKYMAGKNVTKLMEAIEKEASIIYGSAEQREVSTPEEERQYSKSLLQSVKEKVKKGEWEAKLIVLNSKRKQVYPDDSSMEPDIYKTCIELLENGDLTPKKSVDISTESGSGRVRLYEVETETSGNIRAKYFIGYAYAPDMSALLAYTGRLMAVIAAVCLFLAGAGVWMVARSIADPLEELCCQVDEIRSGASSPVRGNYSLLELEKLRDAFNRMEERLRLAEEKNMRFFQNVSHDLRTPLAAITGYAQGIQCGVMKDPEKAAGIILVESLRMTNLVESILTITKMDNHELKLRNVKIELGEFIEEQLEILQGISDHKRLVFERGHREVTVLADPELLTRIFRNIISNCSRYAETKVDIHLELQEKRVIMTIEDDGAGFTEMDLRHIFERFYRGEQGKFGIGLSVVKTGMEYMGGQAEAANREAPLHGAVYRLYFPCRCSE